MPQLLLVVLRVLIFSLLLLEQKLRWQQFRLVMATFLLLIPTIKVYAGSHNNHKYFMLSIYG